MSRNVYRLTNGLQVSRKLGFSEVADQEPSSSHDLPHTMVGHWQFPCKRENKLRELLSRETLLDLSLFS